MTTATQPGPRQGQALVNLIAGRLAFVDPDHDGLCPQLDEATAATVDAAKPGSLLGRLGSLLWDADNLVDPQWPADTWPPNNGEREAWAKGRASEAQRIADALTAIVKADAALISPWADLEKLDEVDPLLAALGQAAAAGDELAEQRAVENLVAAGVRVDYVTPVSFTVGSDVGNGRREVTFEHKGRRYPDVANLADGFQRGKLAERAAAYFEAKGRLEDADSERPLVDALAEAAIATRNGRSQSDDDSDGDAGTDATRLAVLKRALGDDFTGIVQYGEADSTYELQFTDAVVILDSTEQLRSLAKVNARLSERLRGRTVKGVSQKKWPRYAARLQEMADVRPGVTSAEALEERLAEFLAEAAGATRAGSHYDPAQVVTGEAVIVYDAKGQGTGRRWHEGHTDKAFHGTDGKLYLRLGPFQTWLSRNFARITQPKLQAALYSMGFSPERVRPQAAGQRKEARFWTRPL